MVLGDWSLVQASYLVSMMSALAQILVAIDQLAGDRALSPTMEGSPREDRSSRARGSIGQGLSALTEPAGSPQQKVLVVELHHRENERSADTEQ